MKDLVILGGGPGGYLAAIRAATLGMQVSLIEREHLGGICLNWGCIPSKALLKNATIYNYIKEAQKYGIKIEGKVQPDIKEIIKRSREVAKKMEKGVEFLMQKNKIEVIRGNGIIKSKNTIEVTLPDNSKKQVEGRNLIIAVGASPRNLPELKIDGKNILSYKDALQISYIPESMVIVGGGAIGCEFAYFFSSFGTKVYLVEIMERILPFEDSEVSKEVEKIFKRNGIRVYTKSKCAKVETVKDGLNVSIETPLGVETIKCSVVLSAVGITPNTENIGLEKIGVKTEKGKIVVDEMYRTNVEGVYAIGDCINLGPALAHSAYAEGITCVEYIAKKNPPPVDYKNMPSCIYTLPEVASVGYTEDELKKENIKYKVGKFPYSASGKATAVGHRDGFVKLLFDEKWGEILGAHLVGYNVTELISEIVLAKRAEATWYEILKSVHPHPTMSEAISEAAALALGEGLHI